MRTFNKIIALIANLKRFHIIRMTNRNFNNFLTKE